MRLQFLSALRALDRRLAARALRRRRECPGLLVFTLHSLFEGEHEVAAGVVDPFHPVLTSDFERFVASFMEAGYRFVTPAQIVRGLDPSGHHVWVTFDDGYANNVRALAILHAFGVPATFFVSTAHVADGKAFWWDALYRERRRRGVSEAQIRREQEALKSRPHREVEAYMRAEFGAAALDPIGDSDRPMTPAELRAIAAASFATLGNHTADHAVLTRYDDADLRAQIRSAQDFLALVRGDPPEAIAYPDGCCDARVIRLARAEGLRLGAGVNRGKNRLPLTDDSSMQINRYSLPWGSTLLADCALFRSDVGVVNALRRLRARLR